MQSWTAGVQRAWA